MPRGERILRSGPLALLASLLIMLGAAGSAVARPERAVCPGPLAEGFARCHAHVIVDAHGLAATSSSPSGYGPAQFHGAYALATAPPSSAPAQTIAIVDAYDDPSIRNDLTTYDKTFGIPDLPTCSSTVTSACFAKVNQSGAASPLPGASSGWALEIALDVETAHQICQTCKVLLVEANSSSGANLDAAEDTAVRLGATEVSNSWGTESEYLGETAENEHFNHPGIAITVASGDSGYQHFGFPAASPDVIDAGGTTLKVSLSGGSYAWAGEETWSGAGSGCSLYFTAQSFQEAAAGFSLTGCGHSRGVADVAADANPNTGAAVYDSTRYQGRRGWFQVGGTSLASPLIAATYALAGNAATVAYPAALPYGAASALHDITAGASTGSCTTTACKPASGYDGPTGLGSPSGTAGF
ncbi:MAG: peptidase S8 [Actinobacteria bacterium]|nr:MAG: peptidase S8 [Actinomycetota bacterium]